ncbi:MAG: DUF4286 family protein [Paraprevotella sp.]|nr:DUF4286 family protein [Paraprevotella sp.]
MLIYNTTYQVDADDARNFVIWIHQCYLPRVAEFGFLAHPRLSRILSHREADTECFSLQFEVESSARLHHWYNKQGAALNEELKKTFQDKVVGFTTLMEVIEES